MSDKPNEPVGVEDEQAITEEVAPITKAEVEQGQAAVDFDRDRRRLRNIRVKVYSPFRDYYDGQALSISAKNATGPFDILPRHHKFISLLIPCELIIRMLNKEERKIRISGGLMHVKADQVIVFLDV